MSRLMLPRSLALCALVFALVPIQDPQPASRPRPPDDWASRPALPPVADPPRTSVERQDLALTFTPPNPLMGFYELREVVRPGVPGLRARGFLDVERRHIVLHIQGETGDPRRPRLQASVRSYRIVGDTLQMTALVGHRNQDNGDMSIEQPGLMEERRFSLIGPVLRIYQEANAYLEFVRIE